MYIMLLNKSINKVLLHTVTYGLRYIIYVLYNKNLI